MVDTTPTALHDTYMTAAGAVPMTAESVALFAQRAAEQEGRPLPKAWRRRRCRTHGGCYRAAGRWAGQDGAIYTEGIANSQASPDVWVHHAWLTDADGGVIDMAWGGPGLADPGLRYIGVQVPTVEHARILLHTGMFEPILHYVASGNFAERAAA